MIIEERCILLFEIQRNAETSKTTGVDLIDHISRILDYIAQAIII